MNPERHEGLPPELKEMMEEATVEATPAEMAEAKAGELPQEAEAIVDRAFEQAFAGESGSDYKSAVDRLKDEGKFEGGLRQQLLNSVKMLNERGLSEDELNKTAEKMAQKILQRHIETRK
jgi:hypothetical protein